MARGALEWSLRDLARAARISPTTVNQFERGYAATNNSTLAAIRRAFEDAGIIFIDSNGEGPGVRLAERREVGRKKSPPWTDPRRASFFELGHYTVALAVLI